MKGIDQGYGRKNRERMEGDREWVTERGCRGDQAAKAEIRKSDLMSTRCGRNERNSGFTRLG